MELILMTIIAVMASLTGLGFVFGILLSPIKKNIGRLEEGQARFDTELQKIKANQARFDSELREIKANQARSDSELREIKGMISKLLKAQGA